MTARSWICIGDTWGDGCGRVLTDEEREYYGTCCEACVRDSVERVRRWRQGGEDKELDLMFDGPQDGPKPN